MTANVVEFEAPPMPDGYFDSIVSEYDSEPLSGVDEDDDGTRHLTDLGNARRLVDSFGRDIRRCPALSGEGWMVWDGKRWKVDDSLGIVRLAAKVPALLQRDADSMKARASDAKSQGETEEAEKLEKIAKAMEKFARKTESRGSIRAMIDLAMSDTRVIVRKDQLDADRWVINCQNGTLDLKTGRLHPHCRDDLLTRIAGVPYIEDAECPLWEGFLDKIMMGREDMVGFIQRAMGYSLCGTISEQVFIVLWGGGSNGKGTFVNTMKKTFGEYAQSTTPETFLRKRDGSIPNDVAALDGSRFVPASETNEGQLLDESMVKSVTGGDSETIAARFMRGEWFEFVPQFTVWLMTNNKPNIRATDNGIWRRIRLILFEYNFEDDPDKDIHFADKLERDELAGVFAWAVRGCLQWMEGGLSEPPGVIDATLAYRKEMDVVSDFLEDECQFGPNAEIENPDLYKAFCEWVTDNGEYKRSQRWLTKQLKKKGYKQVARKRKVWQGFCLTPRSVGGQQGYGGY